MPDNGQFPYLQQGVIGVKAVHYSTDGLQFFNIGFEQEGQIYINATSYTDWVYISFANKTTVTLSYDEDAPEKWDIAVHRYDVKTNNAKVIETDYTSFNEAMTAVIDKANLVGGCNGFSSGVLFQHKSVFRVWAAC